MMACVVPLSFYGFLSKPKSFVQEICRGQFTGVRLQSPSTTSMNLNRPNCSDRGMCAAKRSCFRTMTLGRNFYEPISHHFNLDVYCQVVCEMREEGEIPNLISTCHFPCNFAPGRYWISVPKEIRETLGCMLDP